MGGSGQGCGAGRLESEQSAGIGLERVLSTVILSPEACSNLQLGFTIVFSESLVRRHRGSGNSHQLTWRKPQDPTPAWWQPAARGGPPGAGEPPAAACGRGKAAEVCVNGRAELEAVAAVWKEFDTQFSREFSLLDLLLKNWTYNPYMIKFILLRRTTLVFSIFTRWQNHHCKIPELLNHPKKKPGTH